MSAETAAQATTNGCAPQEAAPVGKDGVFDAPTIIFDPRSRPQRSDGVGSSVVSSGLVDDGGAYVENPLSRASSDSSGTQKASVPAVGPLDSTQRRSWVMPPMAVEDLQSSLAGAVDCSSGWSFGASDAAPPDRGRHAPNQRPGRPLSASGRASGSSSSGSSSFRIANLRPPAAAAAAAAACAAAPHPSVYSRLPPGSNQAPIQPPKEKPVPQEQDLQVSAPPTQAPPPSPRHGLSGGCSNGSMDALPVGNLIEASGDSCADARLRAALAQVAALQAENAELRAELEATKKDLKVVHHDVSAVTALLALRSSTGSCGSGGGSAPLVAPVMAGGATSSTSSACGGSVTIAAEGGASAAVSNDTLTALAVRNARLEAGAVADRAELARCRSALAECRASLVVFQSEAQVRNRAAQSVAADVSGEGAALERLRAGGGLRPMSREPAMLREGSQRSSRRPQGRRLS